MRWHDSYEQAQHAVTCSYFIATCSLATQTCWKYTILVLHNLKILQFWHSMFELMNKDLLDIAWAFEQVLPIATLFLTSTCCRLYAQ